MSRKKIGYRGRAMCNGKFVYVTSTHGFRWSEHPPSPQDRYTCSFETRRAHEEPVDEEGKTIEVSDVKIVVVYLRTEKVKPAQCEYSESGFCGACEICDATMKRVEQTKGFRDRKWPENWTAGERVLFLVAQGFRGAGRRRCGRLWRSSRR